MSPAIKPRTFAEVFWPSVLVLGGGFFIGLYVLNPSARYSDTQTQLLTVQAAFFGLVMGCLAAYAYKGETLKKEAADPNQLLRSVAVRLAENRFSLESRTESLHAYKPPAQYWIGGRVWVQIEERALRIVGPSYVLKKLKDI